MILYSNGTKKMARKVAKAVPPTTLVPSDCWLALLAPVAKAKGKTPKIKAMDVIIMGRKRIRAARERLVL